MDQSNRSSSTVTWQVARTDKHLHTDTSHFQYLPTKSHQHSNWFLSSSLFLSRLFLSATEDRTWMVIQHNNTELTPVHSSPERSQHSAHFDYAAGEEQLAAIVSQSEHCEQELSYHCRKSRLLNTPGHLTWYILCCVYSCIQARIRCCHFTRLESHSSHFRSRAFKT